MSYEGIDYKLLRFLGVGDNHLLQLPQPNYGNISTTQVDHHALIAPMRRMGHSLQHELGNIAQSIRHTREPSRVLHYTTAFMVEHNIQQDTPSGINWKQHNDNALRSVTM